MKRVITLALIICFVISVMPVLSGNQTAYGETVFQKLARSISKMGKQVPGRKQTEWTSIFQKANKNISRVGETVSAVKSLSLRGNKAELARRRGL